MQKRPYSKPLRLPKLLRTLDIRDFGFLSITFQNIYQEDIERVVIDLTEAHVWDDSGAAALDKIVAKFKEQGIEAELKGLNKASKSLMKQMA